MAHPSQSTVDAAEVHQFSQIAEEWWDENGKFRPLHRMNPARITFLRDRMQTHFGNFEGRTLADIGCGGGLIAEPMARLGFTTTGIDASKENIAIARAHAELSGLPIDYRATTVETVAATGECFDAVLALEIIEHVADVELFLTSCATLVKPGGMLFVSTLNRTLKSLAIAKIGAEYVLRLLPRGTHDWRKFLMPHEIETIAARHGLTLSSSSGIHYQPLKDSFTLSSHDLSVNYLLGFEKSL